MQPTHTLAVGSQAGSLVGQSELCEQAIVDEKSGALFPSSQPSASSAVRRRSLPATASVLADQIRILRGIARHVVEEEVAVLLRVSMATPRDGVARRVEVVAREADPVGRVKRRVPNLERRVVPVVALVNLCVRVAKVVK